MFYKKKEPWKMNPCKKLLGAKLTVKSSVYYWKMDFISLEEGVYITRRWTEYHWKKECISSLGLF